MEEPQLIKRLSGIQLAKLFKQVTSLPVRNIRRDPKNPRYWLADHPHQVMTGGVLRARTFRGIAMLNPGTKQELRKMASAHANNKGRHDARFNSPHTGVDLADA